MNQEIQFRPNLEEAVPFFGVSNMEASLRFYVDGLGFAITHSWTPKNTMEWCALKRGEASLMLQVRRNQQAVEGKWGEGMNICFICEDALALYHEFVAKGLPATEPFVGNGMWVTGLQDPDGYQFYFESNTNVPEETTYSEWKRRQGTSLSYEAHPQIARMVQPGALRWETFHAWSNGRGVDVWKMLCASIVGDLDTIQTLTAQDPRLLNCSYQYFTPIRFAVRENQRAVVEFLLSKGVNPAQEAGASLPALARERGYEELALFLESKLEAQYHITPEAAAVVAAIKSYDKAAVQALLEQRPQLVHAADGAGNQPIHWAVLTRQIDLVDYLLQHGADINAMRPDGARPLDLTNGDYNYRSWYRDLPATALRKHEVLIGYLLARGAYCDISVAAKTGYLERVRELLDEDPTLANRVPAYSGYYSGLPLRNAAAAGHWEVVKLLLERGANPNEPEPGIAPQGGSLHAAIGGKHWDIVKLLLAHGANPNAEVESSGNCLSMAKWVGAPQEIINLLAAHGAVRSLNLVSHDNDLETLGQMLHANPRLPVEGILDGMINGEKRQMLELVLRYQPDVLRRATTDSTAWWDNATPQTPAFMQWLFEQGLGANRRNWLGITLLHRCAAKGNMAVAAVCIEAGADINMVDSEYVSTPLGWAAREGQKNMVEWLLQKGADPTLPKEASWALPAEWAKRRGFTEIAAILEPYK